MILTEVRQGVEYHPAVEQKNQNPLTAYIRHFDENWREEGLPHDWYKFNGIGFSMKSQMSLLTGLDTESKASWAQKTKRDVEGFALEYLSRGLVYSYKYDTDVQTDGTKQLIDRLYKNTPMVDTVSKDERGGVVRETIQQAQEFFLDEKTPDGSLVVRVSPQGPTGLKSDDGKYIDYPDSHIFIEQKKGDSVVGVTIKTDFSLSECREVIKILTGRELPFGASIQEYVKTIAMISPNDRRDDISTPDDIVKVLSDIRFKQSGGALTAYKDKMWREVYRDIARGEDLYNFSRETQEALQDFEAYIDQEDFSRQPLEAAKLHMQKALAATLLRISKYFIEDQTAPSGLYDVKHYADKPSRVVLPGPQQGMSFGNVFNEVKKIEGCAGGGSKDSESTSVFSTTPRLGKKTDSSEDSSNWFTCPKCESSFKPPVGDSCPGCHYSKQDFVKEHPERAC